MTERLNGETVGMRYEPKPTQLSGAAFLAERDRALLADLPRVGKTGTSIIAADYILAQSVLVITTASGRGVWREAWPEWSAMKRSVAMADARNASTADVVIASWGAITQAKLRAMLLTRRWDLLILDEAHMAKNFETKRTQCVYGQLHRDGAELFQTSALAGRANVVWPLTGTPIPNCPLDVYPMLRALAPERLAADPARGWPDAALWSAFKARYAKTRPMKVGKGPWGKWIDVFVEGRNEAELRARMAGFYLQRTQQDVGILEPVYETMPLEFDGDLGAVDEAAVLAAAREGRTKDLEMHLGELRRLTGAAKAPLVATAVLEEMDAGLDKVVLAYWHRYVGNALQMALERVGTVRIDGSSTSAERTAAVNAFRDPRGPRVFLGQIQAAGEAIDLSSAKHLIFVETSFTPKDMLQMSLRVTNHTQTERPLVRVATLAGSIDDALQKILMRKWTAIQGVLGK